MADGAPPPPSPHEEVEKSLPSLSPHPFSKPSPNSINPTAAYATTLIGSHQIRLNEVESPNESNPSTFSTSSVVGMNLSDSRKSNCALKSPALHLDKPSVVFQSSDKKIVIEGLQPKRSYSEAVTGQFHTGISSEARLKENNNQALDFESIVLKPTSWYQGKPSVVFSLSEKNFLVEKLKFVLVGKFSHGRPSLVKIRTFFATLKLKSSCQISVWDKKHIFIECCCKADYHYIWLGLIWFIEGLPMRVLKWTSDFTPMKESAIVPVWIRIEGLPLYLFDEMSLLSIANSIGKPIAVDPRNVSRSIVNSARVCVELDVSQPLMESMWINFEDDKTKKVLEGFWVKVFYDVVPPFCDFCYHLGHDCNSCKRRAESPVSATQLDKEEFLFEDVTLEEGEIAENEELGSVVGDPDAGKPAECKRGIKRDDSSPLPLSLAAQDLAKPNIFEADLQREGQQSWGMGSLELDAGTKATENGEASALGGGAAGEPARELAATSNDPAARKNWFAVGESDIAAGRRAAVGSAQGKATADFPRSDDVEFADELESTAGENAAVEGKNSDAGVVPATAWKSGKSVEFQGASWVADITQAGSGMSVEVQAGYAREHATRMAAGQTVGAAKEVTSKLDGADDMGTGDSKRGEQGQNCAEMLRQKTYCTWTPSEVHRQHSPCRNLGPQEASNVQPFVSVTPIQTQPCTVLQLVGEIAAGTYFSAGPNHVADNKSYIQRLAMKGTPSEELDTNLQGLKGEAVVHHQEAFSELYGINQMDTENGTEQITVSDPTGSKIQLSSSIVGHEQVGKEVGAASCGVLVEEEAQEQSLEEHVFKQILEENGFKPNQEYNLPSPFISPETKALVAKYNPVEQDKECDEVVSINIETKEHIVAPSFDSPPSWDDQMKEQEQQGTPSNVKKVFHTRLPIDFNPEVEDEKGELMTWSQAIGTSKRILASRSLSPAGRSSKKLTELRKRVDLVKWEDGTGVVIDKDKYDQYREEFFRHTAQIQNEARLKREKRALRTQEVTSDVSKADEQDWTTPKKRGRNRKKK